MEINRIYNEDCIGPNGMKLIKDKTIDMILCDLPYGTTACKWDSIIALEKLWQEYIRVIKKNGVIVLFGSQPFTTTLIHSNISMFKYELIWEKSKASDFINANYRPMKKHENVLVFSEGGAAPGCKNPMIYNPQGLIYQENKRVRKGSLGIARDRKSQQGDYISKGTNYPTSILKFSSEGKTFHPTQKPVKLCEYLIKTYSQEKELVLDNCMGSGTTAIACINTGRNFIGFEREEKYYSPSNERISKHLQTMSQ